MQDQIIPARDVVLIGAGHTNLHIVRQWRMCPIPGVKLTLISPFSRATYSGMLPGTLAGLYQPAEMQIDLYRFTAGTGIRLIVAEATGLDPARRLITFADRVPIQFDVASVGIGSVPNRSALRQHSPRILSIKPMATFLQRLQTAVDRARHASSTFKCVIVGSGAAGTEIAFCLDSWFERQGSEATSNTRPLTTASKAPPNTTASKTPPLTKGGQGGLQSPSTPASTHQITLLDGNHEILAGYQPALIRRARTLLAERGIHVKLGHLVERLEETEQGGSGLRLNNGAYVPADLIIWATNASPPNVIEAFGLPRTEDGFLAVRQTLQTTADAPVFVVGDTASFADPDQRVPKAGVYAVREGPILWDNLQRMLAGQPLKEYHPQRGFLSLLSTGDGQALLQYKGWTRHGKWAWHLKDYIDRKFMRMYQDYQPPRMPRGRRISTATNRGPSGVASSRDRPDTHMHCAGCGCKIGPELLSSVLQRLRETFPQATAALQQPDDAYLVPVDGVLPQVLSVDFFRAFLDDPYLLGRVSALHALSDIWAMGGKPLGAQAIITLPYGSSATQGELLFQLLAGAAGELATCGASLWGGHTIEGPELQLGFSVSGDLQSAAAWQKSGLQPGDVLLATKRLGIGTLLAAHQQARCRAEWFDQMLAEMLLSNGPAQTVARRFPIHAATDITGFGLAGHLLEMLQASTCSATVSRKALAQLLLPGFEDLTAQGIESTLAPATRHFVTSHLEVHPGAHVAPQSIDSEMATLIDPQTSGGLLLGVAPDHAAELQSALQAAGFSHTTQVGTVHSRQPAAGQKILSVI